MSTLSLFNDIAFLFYENNIKWKIGGELKLPTEDDIRETLDKMNDRLDNEPRHSSIELGRLLLKDNVEGRGVYLYLGDLPND